MPSSARDLVDVYHGTSHAFRIEIEDYGLRSRPGLSRGVRIALRPELALAHASAYCAYLMMLEHLPPKALVAKATIERSRIREGVGENPLKDFVIAGRTVVGPALTVPDGIRRDEIELKEIELKFLFNPAAAKRALDLWERLTDKKVVLQDRHRS
jgi:hypothetical protein